MPQEGVGLEYTPTGLGWFLAYDFPFREVTP